MPANASFVMSMMSISVCIGDISYSIPNSQVQDTSKETPLRYSTKCPQNDISYSIPNSQVQDAAELFGTLFDKKGQRSANYTMGEDEALVMAQENVTLDTAMGNDRTGANYRKDIKEENHRNVKTPSYQDDYFGLCCVLMKL